MQLEQKQIAQRIRWLMQSLNLNQKQLAERLQVTQPAVSKYIKDRIPPPAVLLKLAQLADTNIEWILTGEKNPAPAMVAEAGSPYLTHLSISEKLDVLPEQIQKQFSVLIDMLLQHYHKKVML